MDLEISIKRNPKIMDLEISIKRNPQNVGNWKDTILNKLWVTEELRK